MVFCIVHTETPEIINPTLGHYPIFDSAESAVLYLRQHQHLYKSHKVMPFNVTMETL